MWKGYCLESDIPLYKYVYGPFNDVPERRYYSFFMLLTMDLCTNDIDCKNLFFSEKDCKGNFK